LKIGREEGGRGKGSKPQEVDAVVWVAKVDATF